MALRIFCFLVLVVSFSFFPWWLSLIFSIFFISLFSNFYEALIPAFFFDLILGTPTVPFSLPLLSWFETQFLFTLGILFLIFIIEWLKDKVVIGGL